MNRLYARDEDNKRQRVDDALVDNILTRQFSPELRVSQGDDDEEEIADDPFSLEDVDDIPKQNRERGFDKVVGSIHVVIYRSFRRLTHLAINRSYSLRIQ